MRGESEKGGWGGRVRRDGERGSEGRLRRGERGGLEREKGG